MKYLELENVKSGIDILYLNKPDKNNTLCHRFLGELSDVLEDYEKTAEGGVLIISGKGKTFCAGAAITEMKDLDYDKAYAFSRAGQDIMLRLEGVGSFNKITIAAVNGYALGGGNELAMACDVRYASEKAKFGQPEVKLGLIPGYGGTVRLPKIVGEGRAMELILTGDIIDAQKAYNIGLVNKVISPEKIIEESVELADKLLMPSPFALNIARMSIKKSSKAYSFLRFGHSYLEKKRCIADYEEEAKLFAKCFATGHPKEGITAFLEKRKPNFK